ncbi:MAG: DUF3786 domain-containing protein [Candidatus Omnitrophica bacterium]|nr:DUF3786 domain-containing protein [Candidatus Omnitrophota bacterium]
MSYAQALDKAWEDVRALSGQECFNIKFISDTCDIFPVSKRAISASCSAGVKDHVAIILLHYLARKLALGKLPELTGEWIDFSALEGGAGYYPAFKKRTESQIVRKYGANPEALFDVARRLSAKRGEFKDVSIIIYPLEEVAILIKMSKADQEFSSSASILFDKNISAIFCTEDIVVLTELIVHQL